MKGRRVSVIITDLDNTLFDWVDLWHRSFRAMLDRLVLDSGIAEDVLIPEFKSIHEKYGTAEYAFSIEELPSLRAKYPGEDLVKRFDEAIHAYRLARKSALSLYPSVAETLETLKDGKCLLIGYTESLSFYTGYRVRKLGLDRILDYLYSPPDHDLPGRAKPQELRRYPERHYELRRTVHRHIRKGETKPDPRVLLEIIRGVGASPSEAIYIGDSLMKDVAMAQKAGVIDVWAKYGVAQNRGDYQLLRKVTHWTAQDVEREKRLGAENVKPQHVLESVFGEVLELFEFGSFLDKSHAHVSFVVDIWKETVDVQQHFNDLELRIRNYALTVMAGVLGLGAYAVKESLQIVVRTHKLSGGALLLFVSTFLWLAFYFMDRFWYHKLLYGAVDHGRSIENRWKEVLPELSLTDSIGRYSPLRLGRFEMHTPRKIDLFYLVGVLFLLVLSFLAQSVVRPDGNAPAAHVTDVASAPRPTNATPPTGYASPIGPSPAMRGSGKADKENQMQKGSSGEGPSK
jgi:phosphoglycolate phosphatase-like HAD superfamily hydrolase